jgi:DNA-binding transcriptional LysR family regulator
MMAETVEEIVGAAAPTVLEVIAPATFAMRWLIPRLPAFSADAATVAIQVRPTHTTEDWLAIPFDVAIRRGGAMPGHLRATPLMGEQLALFGARSLAPAEMSRDLSLLAADTRPGELAAWLGAAGLPTDKVLARATSARRFPHFYIALEAALSGLGALVAPTFLVSDLVARGDLVELFPEIRIAGPGYALAVDPSRPGAVAADRFARWLGAVAA